MSCSQWEMWNPGLSPPSSFVSTLQRATGNAIAALKGIPDNDTFTM